MKPTSQEDIERIERAVVEITKRKRLAKGRPRKRKASPITIGMPDEYTRATIMHLIYSSGKTFTEWFDDHVYQDFSFYIERNSAFNRYAGLHGTPPKKEERLPERGEQVHSESYPPVLPDEEAIDPESIPSNRASGFEIE